jgi:hypothetical protein
MLNFHSITMIRKEPEETCLYKRLLLDYIYGLDKIYSQEEIAKARIGDVSYTNRTEAKDNEAATESHKGVEGMNDNIDKNINKEEISTILDSIRRTRVFDEELGVILWFLQNELLVCKNEQSIGYVIR